MTLPVCPECRTRTPRVARPGGVCHECVPAAAHPATAAGLTVPPAATLAAPERFEVTDGYGRGLVLEAGDIYGAQGYFTAGQCHALAAAIATETGWPMALVRRRCGTCDTCEGYRCHEHYNDGWGTPDPDCEDCEDPDDCGTTYIEHVVVALPTGGYLDAEGQSDRYALGERWGYGDISPDWLESQGWEDGIADLEYVEPADVPAMLEKLAADEGFAPAQLNVAAHFVEAALELVEDPEALAELDQLERTA